ncbi:bifunctional DNA-formamidopyrimidine glycosylase/DNA-(apurinic or apyrimidinic site) lyase [Dendrosporobacter sp. 1207_IL3150]|uniref:bifunctional DNA-formamidopyrimidine glycosylase/DNA-(apurinic or apyrimidinic site) lyase n=1 Tax=Dendrosporobacter sp. 1207_IL3150 TaxID=3084054 RepID=UPI002FD9C2E9
MPEIPEIETVRYHLEKHVQGKTIKHVIVNRDKALNVPIEVFANSVINQEVSSVRRRAKQIIMSLNNAKSIIVHFMLEGYVRLFYANEELVGRPSLILSLDTGENLAFFKINLGYIHLVNTTNLKVMPELEGLGPEPLDPEFKLEDFLSLLSQRKGMIKPLLMDQQFIAGIGNVYSNEVLFCSGILPTRKTSQISEQEQTRLFYCLEDLLNRAIQLGGVYEEKFTSDDVLTGGFEPKLQVAYRTGEQCFVCSDIIKTEKVGGRNAFYCPTCQH